MTNRREFIKNFLIAGGAAAVTHGLLGGTSAAEVLAHPFWSGSATEMAWGISRAWRLSWTISLD